MTGAYTKHMEGERYDRLCETVKECHRLLNEKSVENTRDVQYLVTRLLILVMDYSKKTIEEFVYAGGFTLFFRLVKERSENPFIGSISGILRFFSILLVQQVDPYDENLGVLPMLTYFLCERHTHSVDIEWNHHELTLMMQFLDSILQIVTAKANANVEQSDILTCLHLMSSALKSYPPHRVVNSAIFVFSVERCKKFFTALEEFTELWKNPKHTLLLGEILFSICSFGLGPSISADLPISVLMLNIQSCLLPQLRCPCTQCEFLRRIQRAARERDELGVTKAAESRKQLCFALIQADIMRLLMKLLSTMGTDETKEASCCSETQVKNISNNFTPSPDEGDPDKSLSRWDLNKKFSEETVHSLHQSSDYMLAFSHPENILDKSLRFVAMTLLICSYAYQEIYHGQSIVMYDKSKLLKEWLKCIHKENQWCESKERLKTGINVSIQAICSLILKAPEMKRQSLCNETKDIFLDLFHSICEGVLQKCELSGRGWSPSMGHLVPTFVSLLQIIAHGSNECEATKNVSQPLSDKDIKNACDVTNIFSEGFVYNSSSLDHRVFIKCLLMAKGILTGVESYLKCPEFRRFFFPTAHASTGFMSSTTRMLLQKFDENLAGEEGCVVIRVLGSLIISRAEKASSIIETQKQKNKSIENTVVSCC
ncbi:uncharacterized protein LOC128883897 [Hylaeus volcanicus]|uniref:uncharacterized protein LOC128883897 n=1 Tax=Hylaeus volcanicus TaxID=313075 RepID=UPI0023B87004|nr:uncharacterized protein LOC128883897 [Hylaeus volcanicus]